MFLKRGKQAEDSDLYNGILFRIYRWFLELCLHHRVITASVLCGMLLVAIVGFRACQAASFPIRQDPSSCSTTGYPRGRI